MAPDDTWTLTEQHQPGAGVLVDTISPSGHPGQLIYENGLWWLPDRSMYVYYAPRYWRTPR